MIKKVVLKHFKSHLESVFEFEKGTNVLVGPNGAGKSSVMDAICFGLYGTFPALKARKLSLDDVIMNKPVVKEFAEIDVSFLANGKEYEVKRRIERKKGSYAELRENGKLIEVTTKRVNEKIEEIIGPYELFTRAVYGEQNNIDFFLQLKKGERKRKVDELLNIEKYEKARSSAVTLLNRIKTRMVDLKKVLDSLEKPDISRIKEEIEKVKDVLEELESRERDLTKKMEKVREEIREVEEKKRRFEEINGRIKRIEGFLSGLSTERPKEDKGRIEEMLIKIKERIERARALEKRKATLEKEYALLSKRLLEIEESIKKQVIPKVGDVKPLEDQLDNMTKEFEKVFAKVEECSYAIKELEKSVKILKGAGARCPVCGSDIGEKKWNIIRERENQIKKLVNDMQKAELEKKGLQDKIRALEEEIKRLRILEEKRGLIEKRLKELEAQKRTIEGRMAEVEEEIKSIVIEDVEKLEEQKKAIEKVLEKWDDWEKAKRLREEKRLLEIEWQELKDSPKRWEEIVGKLKDLEGEIKVVREKKGLMEKRKTELFSKLDEALKVKRKIDEMQDEVKKLELILKNVEMLRDALVEIQTILRKEFVETTNALLSDLWKRIYPYKDFVDLRLFVDEDGDYVLQAKRRDGGWVDIEGKVSGGERMAAALCLRIAFSMVLAKHLSWIVLDEPTHNLDKKSIREFAQLLKNHLPSIIEQIFIITHEEELENAASAYIYKLEREKEIDEPTRITKESLID